MHRRLSPLPYLGLLALGALALPACVGSSSNPEGDDEGPIAEVAEALTTCVTFRRGTLGTVDDATIASSVSAPNWTPGALRAGGVFEALIKFDVSSIPATAVVTSATLHLTTGTTVASYPLWARHATAAWSEAAVTYASFNQQISAKNSGNINPSSLNTAMTMTIKPSTVQAWVDGTVPNFGLVLETKVSQPAAWKETVFASSESPTVAQRPALEVCYTTIDDYCVPNPCQNGAACTNEPTGYTCACPAGYTGTNCDVDVDECAAGDPCNLETLELDFLPQGLSCTNTPGSYSCECSNIAAGAACEVTCPCIDAYLQGDGYTALPWLYFGLGLLPGNACFTSASGASIESDGATIVLSPTSCSAAIQETSGADYPLTPAQHTACQQIFDSILTSYDLTCGPDFCSPEPCQNGGSCVNGPTSFTCQCPTGWTGTSCEVDIDECASGGGDLCNLAADPATGVPRGAACINTPGSYSCQCSPFAVGAACEVTCPCIETAGLAGDSATWHAWYDLGTGAASADTCITDSTATTVSSPSVSLTLSPTICSASASGSPGADYPVSATQHAACQQILDTITTQANLSCTASTLCDGVVCNPSADVCHPTGVCNPATGVCSAGPSLTADTTRALAHQWTFDEPSGGTAIDSVGAANGAFGAHASRTTSFDGSGAVLLDPTAQCDKTATVDFGAAPGAFGTGDFTVSFWVATGFSGSGIGDLIGNRTDSTYGNYFSGRLTSSGTPTAEISEDGSGANYGGFTSSATINDTTWHNLVYTRTGTTLTLYIDGVLDGVVTTSATTNIAGYNPLRIGRSLPSCSDPNFFAFKAEYDDIRTYGRALNACDVAALATSYVGAPSTLP